MENLKAKSENQLKEIVKEFNISGRGKSETLAIQNAFTNLRKEVYASIDGCIVFMEPEAFRIDKMTIKEREEKFLWVFMPKIKREYLVKSTIQVRIRYIDYKEDSVEVIRDGKKRLINRLQENSL
ncbi:hypothetical protein TSYNTROOL_09290 [Tepidanaerobacter syntrophicus]|uniref:DUF4312 family protein n=1 Tax=Tepidanaerobacter syntrophicus TaxID=224999 RepID=A0A0U9HEP3_9FIRM|nr:DUF4312 family protein [Tepidanaerobacter syntrophicus]GAQ25296.1 conserved hypothetical protein EF_0831/AHA_3912 [Tepidanaerobacter syntrophicus]GLI50843.1 hypothetical protein TSYNTROOL_09290 [Tepidanaerobacter syntrophicus]HHV83845.1 DUF4312 family protein [Tepidanaerobacter syntrophicus]